MWQIQINDEEYKRKQAESIIYGFRSLGPMVCEETWVCSASNQSNPLCEWDPSDAANKVTYQATPAVNERFYGIRDSSAITKMAPSQLGLPDFEDERIQNLIFHIRMSSQIAHREAIATNLLMLNSYAKEESPESTGLNLGSLQSFYNFIQMYNNLKCPIISLTPDDDIYLSWKGKENRLFSLHFLPGEEVRFVVFKPNDMHPEKEDRFSGRTTFDALKKAVVQYRVWDWISE